MSQSIENHIQGLGLLPPTSSQKVFKDECLYSFDSPFSVDGLDVCLQCFRGTSPNPRHNYTELHAKKTGHSAYLNIKKILKESEVSFLIE